MDTKTTATTAACGYNPLNAGLDAHCKKLLRIAATHRLTFTITEEDVKAAVCSDPTMCVIANSLRRELATVPEIMAFAKNGIDIYVGSRVTKIVLDDRILVYGTPAYLSFALRVFDTTGQWGLPPGQHYLNPMYKTRSRWHAVGKAKNPQKKPQDVFVTRAEATRRVPRIHVLLTKKILPKK